MLSQGGRGVREVGPALSAVARAAVALARVGALLDRDAGWAPAWLDRLQALETASAAALETGGPVLIDDVRDVDHKMAAGGARTLAIDGLRKMWRAEGAVPTRDLDGEAVLAALGRRTHVQALRYLGLSAPAPGAWRAVTPDPTALGGAVVRFVDELEICAAGLPGPAAAAAALAAWAAAGCSHAGVGCWAAACLLRQRLKLPITLPLLATGFGNKRSEFRPSTDSLAWIVVVCDALAGATERAIDMWETMGRNADGLARALDGRGGPLTAAVQELARQRDSFTAAELAGAAKTSDRAARRLLGELRAAETLREVTGRGAFRAYGL